MVLGKLPVPGRLTNLDESRTRAYCACSGCGWGSLGHLFSRLSFILSFSLSLGDGKFVHVHLKCFSLKVHSCQVS